MGTQLRDATNTLKTIQEPEKMSETDLDLESSCASAATAMSSDVCLPGDAANPLLGPKLLAGGTECLFSCGKGICY